MRKLVRLLLVHYDRFGIIALVGWLVSMIGVIAIPTLLVDQFFHQITNLNDRFISFIAIFVVLPIVIYFYPALQTAGFLLIERLWMCVGIYTLFGWEPYRFRKLVGRLAHENKNEDKES